jgi:lysophospholipase L1-like esterase
MLPNNMTGAESADDGKSSPGDKSPGGERPAARPLAKLALLLGTLVVVVALLELGFRFAGYGPSTHLRWFAHPDLHYTAAPNQQGTVQVADEGAGERTIHVYINGYGQRCDDFLLEKEPGEFRVVVLGDSLTFGPGVGNDETFALQAESLLNHEQGESGSGESFVRLVNVAANGYSTIHYLRWMETQLETYRPDLVVMGLYIGNDLVIATRNRLFNPVPFPGVVRNSAIGHYLLENHRPVLMDLAEAMAPAESQSRLLEPIDKSLRRFVNVPEDELGYDDKVLLWRHAMGHVTRMRELAEAAGIPFVCLLIPQSHMVSNDNDYPLHGWLRRGVERAGLSVILPDAELRPLGMQGWHSYDPGHLNVDGHAAVGRALARGLRELGYVP